MVRLIFLAALLVSCGRVAEDAARDGGTEGSGGSTSGTGGTGATGGQGPSPSKALECQDACAASLPSGDLSACGGEEGALEMCVAICIEQEGPPGCASCTVELGFWDAGCNAMECLCVFAPAARNGCGCAALCDQTTPELCPCQDDDECQAECIAPCERQGICQVPGSGECICGGEVSDFCGRNRRCVCPRCGEGEGICVNDADKAELCRSAVADQWRCD